MVAKRQDNENLAKERANSYRKSGGWTINKPAANFQLQASFMSCSKM